MIRDEELGRSLVGLPFDTRILLNPSITSVITNPRLLRNLVEEIVNYLMHTVKILHIGSAI